MTAEAVASGATLLRRCTACGARNRAPVRHLADTGRCGACRAELGPVSEPIDADAESFDAIVRDARVPVLVDFWAEWCAPCRMVAPEVGALAREMAGRALVLKVDTQAQPALAARFQIQAIPHFAVFRDGRPVLRKAGAAPRAEMRRWIEESA